MATQLGRILRTVSSSPRALASRSLSSSSISEPSPKRLLQIGDVLTEFRQFSESDVEGYAAVSGHRNPIHLDPEFTRTVEGFAGGRLVHGMLVASLFPFVIASRFPGAVRIGMAGAQCCENPPVLCSSCGEGCLADNFGGLKTYVAGSDDSKAAVVLVSDIFGYEAPNLRKLADKVAAAGFLVVVPDFFYGDPYVMDPEKPINTWLQNHGAGKGFEDAKPVIEELKRKGISAIGAAGFCWGAKVAVELAKAEYIKAVVMLHPSLVTVDDIKELKCPTAILAAEIDNISPPALVKQFEGILSTENEVDSFVKIFPRVVHGWTIRYDTDDDADVKKAEEAHKDMLNWFIKHL